MQMRRRSYEMDMTSGPIMSKLIMFALPLMASSVLQLLFNAADVVVVGRFDGSLALAAVGSTGSLVNLITNLFLGLSTGTNVIVARYYGAGKYKETQETVHTSIAVSLIGGVILAIFGFFMVGTFLGWMGSPEDVRPLATLYLKIYFLGMPFMMLYNFGASILRAVGDTRRPLVYLSISGVVNVILNLVLVIVFHMGVAGVALATITSQAISAVLVLLCLMRSEGAVHVELNKIRVHGEHLKELSKIGIPAGLQGMCFSLSNVLIQSTVNSFGSTAVAGNSVSSNLEGFVWVAMNAFHQAAVTFTSQCVGARKYARIRKVCLANILAVCVVGFGLGVLILLLKDVLMGLYTTDVEAIQIGEVRLKLFMLTYFTGGLMDVMCGALRGLGSTMTPMIVSIMGACAFRIFWIVCIMPMNYTLMTLYISYPISWVLTAAVHGICYVMKLRKFPVGEGASD